MPTPEDFPEGTVAAVLPVEPAEWDPKSAGPGWADRGVRCANADKTLTLDVAVSDAMPSVLILRCHQTGAVYQADLRYVAQAVLEAIEANPEPTS